MKSLFSLFLLASGWVLVTSQPVRAADTFIDFDNLTYTNPTPVPVGYQSSALNTPDILVGYRSFDSGTGTTVDASINLWNLNYGDLNKVGIASQTGLGAEIALTPTNGATVTLASFDLGGRPRTDIAAAFIRVVDGAGTVLWSASNLTVAGTGSTHSSYSPNLTAAGVLRIQWGTDSNIGIDNVRFSQSPLAAPEPTTLALIGLGSALVLLRRRR
jgi:hypothetical protein